MDEQVSLPNQALKNVSATAVFEVQSDATLIGIEVEE